MASIKVNRTKYGKYIRAVVSGVSKTINLKTDDSKVALHRIAKVQKIEKEYKRLGCIEEILNIEWEWDEGSNGVTRLKKLTLSLCVDEWLKSCRIRLRKSTLDRYRVSLNAFINVMGRTCPMRSINNKSIEDFKGFYDGKHTTGGIDINLRGIKVFLLWALEEGHIKKMPKIVQFNVKTRPKYINELNWNKLMSLDLDDYWKDVWRLYRDVGLRLKEIIMGSIDGDFLIVRAEDTKSKKELEAFITDEQKCIIQSIHTKRDKHLSNKYKIETFIWKYSKIFHDACKELELDYNFHCLRHTFAVRKYIETRDILMVSKMLNHESLVPTEQYSKFNIYRLEQEFPSLVKKESKKDDLDTIKVDTTANIPINPPLRN